MPVMVFVLAIVFAGLISASGSGSGSGVMRSIMQWTDGGFFDPGCLMSLCTTASLPLAAEPSLLSPLCLA